MLIRDLLQTFESRKIDYALVGGYALALHGIIRATMDIDLVVRIRPPELQATEEALQEIGLTSRLPIRAEEVAHFRDEYVRERNLIAWSFIDLKDQTRQVDLLIRYDLKDVQVQTVRWEGHKVRVATLESLLKMKLEAGRPQDLVDAEKIRQKIQDKKS